KFPPHNGMAATNTSVLAGEPSVQRKSDRRVSSSKDEALDEGIFRVKVEFISANDRGGSSDFGNKSVVRTEIRSFHGLHRHRAAKNAFDSDLLVQMQLTPGMVQRCASADAGASG